jgi:hypothetical protein
MELLEIIFQLLGDSTSALMFIALMVVIGVIALVILL